MPRQNVVIHVTGYQQLIENPCEEGKNWSLSAEIDRTDTKTTGFCSCKDGSWFLLYEEGDGEEGVVHHTVKISKDSFQVTKRGQVVSKLQFAPGCFEETSYETPFGVIHLGIKTEKVKIRVLELPEREKLACIQAEAEYRMDMDHIPTAFCKVQIDVRPL